MSRPGESTDSSRPPEFLQEARPATDAAPALAEVAIRYGMFLNSIVEFLIVGLSAFIAVRVMSRVMQARSA